MCMCVFLSIAKKSKVYYHIPRQIRIDAEFKVVGGARPASACLCASWKELSGYAGAAVACEDG